MNNYCYIHRSTIKNEWCYENGVVNFFFFYLGLMGLLEKRRFKNLLVWASDYDENQPKTFNSMWVLNYPYVVTWPSKGGDHSAL